MVLKNLLLFMNFLEKEAGFKFDVEKFEHRLMLQKYVFISKFMGLNLGYPYSIYLRGPYSSELADDYYKLADHYLSYTGDYTEATGSLDTKKFLEVIEGKDVKWLEIASTILSVYDRHREIISGAELEEGVISISCNIKSTIEVEKICRVFEELKESGLIDV